MWWVGSLLWHQPDLVQAALSHFVDSGWRARVGSLSCSMADHPQTIVAANTFSSLKSLGHNFRGQAILFYSLLFLFAFAPLTLLFDMLCREDPFNC